jgi:hypothetical protein
MKYEEWKPIVWKGLRRKWPRILAGLGALANVGRLVLMLVHHSP